VRDDRRADYQVLHGGAVVGVAAVAAVASYEHAYALVRVHGETGWIGRLVPLTVDGLIYASSMVLLDSARRQVRVPAVALAGFYELFMTVIRGARQPDGGVSGTSEHVPGAVSGADPLRVRAAEVFAAEVAAGRLPSIRAIRSRLCVGQPRAQQVRAYLAALGDG
jgi:hypothetical protein